MRAFCRPPPGGNPAGRHRAIRRPTRRFPRPSTYSPWGALSTKCWPEACPSRCPTCANSTPTRRNSWPASFRARWIHYPSTRVGNATEFFLTACLACRVEAGSVPERIPLDSASASLLGTWAFLPPLEPPRAHFDEESRSGKTRPASLGLGPDRSSHSRGGNIRLDAIREADLCRRSRNSFRRQRRLHPRRLSFRTIELPTETPVPTLDAPDGLGGKIVFTCTRDDLNQLCMVAPTGGKVSRVTSEYAHDYYPSFSPAGNMLLYASNRDGNFDLYVKLLGSDILTKLTNEIGEVSSASFSPDGSQVAFSNSVGGKPSGLWLVNKDGSDPAKNL